MDLTKLETEINQIWKKKENLNPKSNKKIINSIKMTIKLIDQGKIRVSEKKK